MNKTLLFLYLFSLGSFSGSAQIARDAEIFLQLQAMDSLLFELGFNNCDLPALEKCVSEDLEFYHDQAGVSLTRSDFLKRVKENICSDSLRKPIRQLRDQGLEVFPLYENDQLYGAIQSGTHDFYIREPGRELEFTSTAKFTHLWLLEDQRWILKRVLSYDHKTK